jgi:GT2 family glycosyltransferase
MKLIKRIKRKLIYHYHLFLKKIKKLLINFNKLFKSIVLHPKRIIKGIYILITKGLKELKKEYINIQKKDRKTLYKNNKSIFFFLVFNKYFKKIFKCLIPIIYFFLVTILFIISLIIKSIYSLFSHKISIKTNEKKIDGVSFIIPTWNKKDMVLTCIKLLDEHLSKEQPKIKKEIIVIENGSIDGSAEAIEKLKTKIPIVLLKQKTNIGFARAINLGLKHSKYNYVYLINNDMEPQKGFFDSIIKSAQKLLKQKMDFFGISSQIFFFDPNKRREESGKTYSLPNSGYVSIAHYVQEEALTEFSPTLYPGGGSSLINKRYFQSIGGYDYKSFTPLYCEDLDAGFIAWKLGLPSYFDPNSKVIHHHRSSSVKLIQDPNYFMYKNWLVLVLKNFDSPKNILNHILLYPFKIVFSNSHTKYAIEAIKNLKNIFLSKIKLYKYTTINSDSSLINFPKFENNFK